MAEMGGRNVRPVNLPIKIKLREISRSWNKDLLSNSGAVF